MVSHGPAASVELADTIGQTNHRDARPSTAGVVKKPGTPVGETAATTLVRESGARAVVVPGSIGFLAPVPTDDEVRRVLHL